MLLTVECLRWGMQLNRIFTMWLHWKRFDVTWLSAYKILSYFISFDSNSCLLKTKSATVRWGICVCLRVPQLSGRFFQSSFMSFAVLGEGQLGWLKSMWGRFVKCEPVLNRTVWTKDRVITAGLPKSELCYAYQSNIIGLFLFDINLTCQQYGELDSLFAQHRQLKPGFDFFIHSI